MKKRTQEKGEKAFLIVLGIFALVCLAASLKLFLGAPRLSGEGTIPALCSLVMLVMVGVILLELRGGEHPFEEGIPPVQKLKEVYAYLFPGKVGLIVVYCLLYAVLLGVVGFVVSTAVFLVLSMLTLDSRKKLRMLVIAGITVVCVLVVFQYIFQVQLP